MMLLTGLVASFLFAASVVTLNSGWEETDAKLFWLTEAGLQKGIWNLKTPASGGGQGEDWTTSGTSEGLGDGSTSMVVTRYDFALAANGGSASASSSSGSNVAANAIDGSDSTYWESASKPTPANPEQIVIQFPYPLVLNKVRFLAATSQQRPKDYTWSVSSDGSSYTDVASSPVNGNDDTDVTDTFSAQSSVSYLRLQVTGVGGGSSGVRIATLEAIGAKVTATGTIGSLTRTVVQTVVADDANPQNQVAYTEPDWSES